MSLVLYYGSGSSWAWRAQLALEHKALPYELKVLSFSAGDTRKPEFIALNPRHQVPTLVDGALTLWESRAIIQYLAAQRPASGLLGKDEADRAEITRWLTWDAAHLSPPVGTLIFETLFKPLLGLGAADPDAIHRATGEVRRFFADPTVVKNFLDPQLFEPIAGTPEQLSDYLGSEARKWSQVIHDANIKAE